MFRVVGDSMGPTLSPGDWVLTVRGGRVRSGQVRVFRDPRRSTRWLVKRVGDVHTSSSGTVFDARSDNPRAIGSADSHEFGPVSATETYRVVWPMRTEFSR
ncbi:S26 family signal peptidase [Mycobacterium sp. IDR2000157661]|nr:S26 family signal peptidase [Mycobacterium sp. IDR2000157661]ULE35621.1 S26 family signal peptidase [Mycobacterium sp. IDR2000157661]